MNDLEKIKTWKKKSKKNVLLIAGMTTQGITSEQLAEKVGVSIGAISLLRRGERACNVLTAIRIGRELGFTVEDLWGSMVEEVEPNND